MCTKSLFINKTKSKSALLAEPDAADDEVVPVDEDGLNLGRVEQLRLPDWVDEQVPDDLEGLQEVLGPVS